MNYFIGFDPGGDKAFGWAVLVSRGDRADFVASGTCSSAPSAMAAATLHTPIPPAAIATDAPLFWVNAGDRKADSFVRKMVCARGGRSGTVSHVNSLRGACLAQGILVTKLAIDAWPHAQITEAHPKALLRTCSTASDFAKSLQRHTASDHERDAAVAAYAAWAFATSQSGWHDLSLLEEGAFFPAGKPAAYWFPKVSS